MKKSAILILLLIPAMALSLPAQTSTSGNFERFRKEKRAQFEKYRQDKRTEFEQYRRKLNEEFADMMERNWKDYDPSPEQKRKEKPKPTKPLDAENTKIISPQEIPVDVVTPPEPVIPDIPVTLPRVTPGRTADYPVTFTFYHTPCGINSFDTSVLDFSNISSGTLASAWRRLSGHADTETLVNDCLRLREELNLCDWGYVKVVEAAAKKLYPASADKQAFLTVFLLNQSGYDAKLASRDGRLHALVHPSHTLYFRSGTIISGKAYYLISQSGKSSSAFKACDTDFRKGATPIRMVMNRIPAFAADKTKYRTYTSSKWQKAPPVEVKVNPSVIEFMNDYPILDWNLYGMSQLSPQVRSTIYAALSVIIEGMDAVEAVNTLLDYMQTGFEYMTDGNQFGYEKPFFFDENFYYPANDCEDRAILFAEFVKSLLGLDVVYLNYPRHLATAVRLPYDIDGTYVTVDGKKYYVCDPTCINGKAGILAAVYSASRPKVVKIAE